MFSSFVILFSIIVSVPALTCIPIQEAAAEVPDLHVKLEMILFFIITVPVLAFSIPINSFNTVCEVAPKSRLLARLPPMILFSIFFKPLPVQTIPLILVKMVVPLPTRLIPPMILFFTIF